MFHDNFRIVLNGSRDSYPGYMTIPRNACQIPQRDEILRLGDKVPCSGSSNGA